MKRAWLMVCMLVLCVLLGCSGGGGTATSSPDEKLTPEQIEVLRQEYPAVTGHMMAESMGSLMDWSLSEILHDDARGALVVLETLGELDPVVKNLYEYSPDKQTVDEGTKEDFKPHDISAYDVEYALYAIRVSEVLWESPDGAKAEDVSFEAGKEYTIVTNAATREVDPFMQKPGNKIIARIYWDEGNFKEEGHINCVMQDSYYVTKDGHVLFTREQENVADKRYDGMPLKEFRRKIDAMMQGWEGYVEPETSGADYSSKPFDQQEVAPTPTYK